LPIAPGVRSIALIGPMADDPQTPLGPWFADGRNEDTVTLLEGLRAKVAGRHETVTIAHAKGCEAVGGNRDGFDEAVKLARASDLAILAVGEPSTQSGEATSLAILEAWYPGTQAGHAIADALFGDVNPGGKLPVTFPRSVGQIPLYYNHANTGRPMTDFKYTSKYVDIANSPLYPFGFGLSYTRFRLSDLKLSASEIAVDGRIIASVSLKNVGSRVGDEVVQLYVRDEVASVTRPVKELRGFRRVTLRPGESRTLSFPVGPEDLGCYGRSMRFAVEPGRFQVIVGTSSEGGLVAPLEVV
jgi:beta-glucosidase